MAVLVIIVLVVLIAVIVSVAKGVDSSVSPHDSTSFQNSPLKADSSFHQPNSRRNFSQGDFPEPENDFDQLMTPGSNSAAWFNAADEQGYDPEDW